MSLLRGYKALGGDVGLFGHGVNLRNARFCRCVRRDVSEHVFCCAFAYESFHWKCCTLYPLNRDTQIPWYKFKSNRNLGLNVYHEIWIWVCQIRGFRGCSIFSSHKEAIVSFCSLSFCAWISHKSAQQCVAVCSSVWLLPRVLTWIPHKLAQQGCGRVSFRIPAQSVTSITLNNVSLMQHVYLFVCTVYYVCIYVCIYICMHNVCMYIYMYAQSLTSMTLSNISLMSVCMYAHSVMYACMYVCMHIYIYIYICMHSRLSPSLLEL